MRRFTRQKTEKDTWVFVRLAEVETLPYYLLGLAATPTRLIHFLRAGKVSLMFHFMHEGRLISVAPSVDLEALSPGPMLLGAPKEAAFRRYRWDRYCILVSDELHIAHPEEAERLQVSSKHADM